MDEDVAFIRVRIRANSICSSRSSIDTDLRTLTHLQRLTIFGVTTDPPALDRLTIGDRLCQVILYALKIHLVIQHSLSCHFMAMAGCSQTLAYKAIFQ